MRETLWKTLRPKFTLSASALTQLLSGFACFLAAFVLPNTLPEFKGMTVNVLIGLGFLASLIGLGNLFYGRHISRLLTRAGKRSRVVVPREGVGYLTIMLALAVGALMGHRNMPLLVFGMMAGPFILNGAIVYQMLRRVSVERRMVRRAMVGESVSVEFELRNEKRFLASHMLEVRDRISEARGENVEADAEGMVTFFRVPSGERRTGRYEMSFERRGRYQFGPVRVSSRFPMGIGERGQVFADSAELVVRPELGRLLPRWMRQQKELAEATQQQQRRQGIFDDEFHRIREYRQDDNPRNIHWRSTARRGQLMVREHHQNRQADSLLVLHLPELKEWSRKESETAISLAATFCVTQTKASSGSRYLLMVVGAENTVIESRLPAGFREEALDQLATCRRSKKADLVAALTHLLVDYGVSDERMVLITPEPERAMEALVSVNDAFPNRSFDLLQQTTTIEATAESMEEIFLLDEAGPLSPIPPAAAQSMVAGGAV